MSYLLYQVIASGIVTGCVYALVALSLVIIYKSTDVVNFAGGELVMIGGYLGLGVLALLKFGAIALAPLMVPYALMCIAVVAAMFVIGGAFERITLNTVRGRRYGKDAALVPLVVATIGLSYLLKGVVRVIPYTEEVRRLPPLIAGPPVFFGEVVLERQDLAIVGLTVLVVIAMTLFFGWTQSGKALRATSQNTRAAALIGIPVKSMRMLAWGLAAVLAGIAGILLSPKLLMTPDMGSVVMIAFAAAAIGGFTSMIGCVVGGIILGVVQNFVGILISPQAISVTPFFIIMLVLVLRPQGLFGEVAVKKV